MNEPILFARIGWMEYYNGPQADDEKPKGGGKYTETGIGHEAFNFKTINGQRFGYFQPPMQTSSIALQRIAPGTKGDALS